MHDSPLNRLFERMSQAELARRLGVTPYAVTKWKQGKVPAERVLDIERASDGLLSRHDLRPDIYPREQTA